MRALAVVALIGCGRLDFAALHDVAAPDAPCTAWGPFAPPVRLPGPVNSAVFDDWFPSPFDGQRGLMFHTFRFGSQSDVWQATRASVADDFDPPVEISPSPSSASPYPIGRNATAHLYTSRAWKRNTPCYRRLLRNVGSESPTPTASTQVISGIS